MLNTDDCLHPESLPMTSAHIGIVACSAEGAALCYRTICNEAQASMGEHMHPEVSMHTIPLGEYMEHVKAGDWEKVGTLMLRSAEKLASIGATFAICPDNTLHQAFAHVAMNTPIPFIHIAEAVADMARSRGYSSLGLTGTKYLMTSPVYPSVLEAMGIDCMIPDRGEREKIDYIIFKELVNGRFPEESRVFFNEVISTFKMRGADAVILGCTEIPLLVDPSDCPLPTLDSTRLLARAALQRSLT